MKFIYFIHLQTTQCFVKLLEIFFQSVQQNTVIHDSGSSLKLFLRDLTEFLRRYVTTDKT